MEDGVLGHHAERRRDPRDADWLVDVGRYTVAYNHPADGDEAARSLSRSGGGRSIWLPPAPDRHREGNGGGVPAGLTAAQACMGTVLLNVRRSTRTIVSRCVRQSQCVFKKTFETKRRLVGRARKLKLGVIVAGNSGVRGASKTYTIKVKRR